MASAKAEWQPEAHSHKNSSNQQRISPYRSRFGPVAIERLR
jgi:hypothetical protein